MGHFPHVDPSIGSRDAPCQRCREKGVKVVFSDDLLQGARELFIVHRGQTYRLLLTRNDKLILQK